MLVVLNLAFGWKSFVFIDAGANGNGPSKFKEVLK